ncbi:MAG: carbohydrate ABC transporter permease [Bacilli bacterium]|nr:carbohydrate ABC transporter permease [Bacilli bacterium]
MFFKKKKQQNTVSDADSSSDTSPRIAPKPVSPVVLPIIKHGKNRQRGTGGMVVGKDLSSRVVDIVIYFILTIALFVSIIPLWHVLMASVSDPKQIAFGIGNTYKWGVVWWPVGDGLHFEGYEYIFKDGSIFRGYLNTIIYVILATGIGMVINILGGYVISRNIKAKGAITIFVMFTAMFHGGLIPTYAVIKGLNMTDTIWSIVIPGCTNAFFVIMLANAFRTVPESTIESARIDGAGHMRIMWQILLPQALPLATVVILNSVILQWNSWMNASIYLSSSVNDLWPLQLIVRELSAKSEQFIGSGRPNYALFLVRYTVIVASTLPILCVFPFFQKLMETNVVAGAVKG